MTIDPDRVPEITKLVDEISSAGGTAERLAQLAELVSSEAALVADTVKAGAVKGTVEASVIILRLPRADVAKLLPLGLQLAPNPVSTPQTHPVFLQFSSECVDVLGDVEYAGVRIGVPFVQLSTWKAPRRGPFIYMPRLYVDSEAVKLLANHLYGYEDELATIDLMQPQGTVPGQATVTPAGAASDVLSATFIPEGDPGPAASFERFAEIRTLFEMPTISQASRIWNPDAFDSDDLSPMLATNLVYDFDADTASILPIVAELTVGAGLTPPGIPPGQYRSESLASARLGAFRMSVPQRLELPGGPATVRYPRPVPSKRQRVLVLGGGPSACAAAYWLAKQTDRYSVEMYTLGWRLGGKCAAGRNVEADARIEEHGLHAFLGFYENAIRTVRDVWFTAGIPIAEGDDPLGGAFIGSSHNGVMALRDKWRYYATPLQNNDRIPGYVPPEGLDPGEPPSDSDRRIPQSRHGLGLALIEVFEYLGRLVVDLHREPPAAEPPASESAGSYEDDPESGDGLLGRLRRSGHRFAQKIEDEISELLRAMVRYIEDVAAVTFEKWLEEGPDGPLRHVMRLAKLARHIMNGVYEMFGDDDEVWYLWMSMNSMLTVVIGLIADRVSHLDQLDHIDTWEFLIQHGLDQRLVPEGLRTQPVEGGQQNGSPAIAAVYETLFAHGTEAVPRDMAASVGLRWLLLTGFGYAGYPAYEFKYSCPQTLLTPYYKALTGPLGAKINFFHEVKELVVEGQGDSAKLVKVRLRRQATVKGGPAAYDPFLPDPPLNNPEQLPPWPIVPNYDQLEEGEALRSQGIDLESPWTPWPGVEDVELVQGRDFDICVLGITMGALPPLTSALWDESSPSHDPRWTRMVNDVWVTRTISMQLWFDVPASELYGDQRGLLTEYALPEPSMADFTHLIQWEGWKNPPKFLAYHTGSLTAQSAFDHAPFDDHEHPAKIDAEWVEQARAWTKEYHAPFYDAAPADWEGFTKLLSLPSGAPPDADRFAAQYFNSGVNMSDRYVLSQPKGMPARMLQTDSGVQHLFLCGDWTKTDMNCGCVEAATQAGMLCARGISQFPTYVWHPGY